MGYEDGGDYHHHHHHHHHLNVQISIPSYFRCPISSDLMDDPVTLCTGNTYDRASIQRWLSDGNNFCPVTRKNLQTQEMIPNHTLRRLIQAWRVGNQPKGGDDEDRTPRQPNGEDEDRTRRQQEQPLESQQLESIVRAIASSGRRKQALADLRAKAMESEENRRRIADEDTGAVEAMAVAICTEGGGSPSPACQDAIAILSLLPINHSHRKILARSNLLSALSSTLHTDSLPARRNTAILLEKLATSRDECTVLGSIAAIIEGLVRLVEEDLHRHAVKTPLRSLLAICSPLRNRVKAVEAGAVDLLVELLPESERSTAELTLSVLELLCRCAEGRVAITEHPLAIPVLARKLFTVSDAGTDSAVVILWALCKYSPANKRIQRRVIESGILSKLFYFVQTDYKSRIKLKAADLLRILHKSCKHQIPL